MRNTVASLLRKSRQKWLDVQSMEPFAPFVRKSMCWIFTALPHISLKMQLTLVNSWVFVFFHFGKEKGYLWLQMQLSCYSLSGFQLHVSAVARHVLVKMTVNTFSFVSWGVEGDQTSVYGGTHTCMYIHLSVAFREGRREIMDTAPTCLCMGKRKHKQNKNSAGKGRHQGEAWPPMECW